MANPRVPSKAFLRSFLKPSAVPTCTSQTRQASNYMPRSKFANITRLDKLHRTQKAAARQAKLIAIQRADALSATFSPSTTSSSPSTAATTPTTPSTLSLPFTISRTPASNLPIYETSKSGGSKQITTIRKLSGDLDTLAAQLRTVLNMPEYTVDKKGNKKASVAVNQLTKQVIVKGWRGEEVKAWMAGVGF